MAEGQSAHRRQVEDKLAGAAIQEMRLKFGEARFGQVCALVLAVAFVSAGTYAIIQGHGAAGAAVAVTGGGIGIPAIISAFMRGRIEPSVDRPTIAKQGKPTAPAKQKSKK
jgi:uncharacterized membrane protein